MGSAPDADRIAVRAAYIREQLGRLRRVAAAHPVTFSGAETWMEAAAVRYALHTSVEALIDIAFHISAKRLNRAPADAYDAFAGLAAAGLLPPEAAAPARDLVGFRNRLVHRYQDVTDARVLAMIRDQLADFEAILAALEAAGRPSPPDTPPR